MIFLILTNGSSGWRFQFLFDHSQIIFTIFLFRASELSETARLLLTDSVEFFLQVIYKFAVNQSLQPVPYELTNLLGTFIISQEKFIPFSANLFQKRMRNQNLHQMKIESKHTYLQFLKSFFSYFYLPIVAINFLLQSLLCFLLFLYNCQAFFLNIIILYFFCFASLLIAIEQSACSSYCILFKQFVLAFVPASKIEKYIIEQKVMINTPKSKTLLLDLMNRVTSKKENMNRSFTNSTNLPKKPSQLEISKYNPHSGEAPLTPKTARSTHYRTANTNEDNSSKSGHITPDKNINKQRSFVDLKKLRFQQPSTKPAQAKTAHPKLQFRIDNERKISKNVGFKQNIQTSTVVQTKLRETVSNPYQAQILSQYPPKPVKSQIQFSDASQKDKLGKKNAQSIKYQQGKEQVDRPKFIPRNHTRTKTTNDQTQNHFSHLMLKHPYTQNNTPRISQQKLTLSVNVKIKDPTMNATDPQGNYFSKSPLLSKRLSSTLTPRQKQQFLSLSDFQLGSCKGQGRFGKVFPAKHKKTGFLLAIKQVKKESIRLMQQQFIQELKINLYLNHSNVVKMFGFFHDTNHFYILMQYMEEGSLYKHIKMNKKISETQAALKLSQVCQAVKYLHSIDILHRDIKPENIVLSNGVCKLCDFGWAIYSKERRTTYCGTLDYVCPNILEGESYDNFVDIWAIGVLAYEMIIGKAPFYHISRQQTMKSIMKCDFDLPSEVSSEAKRFIRKALQKDQDRRVTIQDLLKEEYLHHQSEYN